MKNQKPSIDQLINQMLKMDFNKLAVINKQTKLYTLLNAKYNNKYYNSNKLKFQLQLL